jgi:hypothetical protein
MIFYSEIARKRITVYVIEREACRFQDGNLMDGSGPQQISWRTLNLWLKEYELEDMGVGTAHSNPINGDWQTEIVALKGAYVTTSGAKAYAKENAVVVGHKEALIKLADRAVGFAFSGSILYPQQAATAVGISGSIEPSEVGEVLCFAAPQVRVSPGFSHHSFNGSESDFKRVWQSVRPGRKAPSWPVNQ